MKNIAISIHRDTSHVLSMSMLVPVSPGLPRDVAAPRSDTATAPLNIALKPSQTFIVLSAFVALASAAHAPAPYHAPAPHGSYEPAPAHYSYGYA